VTDTGNFKHSNVTANTFNVASELAKRGADFNKIVYNTFTKQSKARAKLFGAVTSKIRYAFQDRFAIITITKKAIEEAGATPDETEGFIDFIMGIDTVEIGASVMEMANNKFKVSLRSKNADVNAVASSFGGGGHVHASGCQIQGEYEEVIDRLSFAVSRELPD
jgi:phosphoesterase RecJ-like protein